MREPVCIVFRDLCPDLGWAPQFHDLLSRFERVKLQLYRVTGYPKTNETLKAADIRVVSVCKTELDSGVAAVEVLRRADKHSPVLVVTDAQSEHAFHDLVSAGATDFISPPLREPEVLGRLVRFLRLVRLGPACPKQTNSAEHANSNSYGIIGRAPAIFEEISKIGKYALSDAAVLIQGETGTGKELFARAVHDSGERASKPFLPVNCAAIPLELCENEFFGHQKGAFTGAAGRSEGLLARAEGGTLFLDEIECLPLVIQAKLLRFLQDRWYRPLGAADDRRANVRIIAASNRALAQMIERNEFRRDLFFRLNVLPLHLPALRDRRQDIPELVTHLVAKHAQDLQRSVPRIADRVFAKLMSYDWPGNVRELENILQRTIVLNGAELIEDIEIEGLDEPAAAASESFKAQKTRAIREFETRYLKDALVRSSGNISRAARLANKARRNFFELLKKHGLAGSPRTVASKPDALPSLSNGHGNGSHQHPLRS